MRLLNEAVLDGSHLLKPMFDRLIHDERVRAHQKHDDNGMSMEREPFDSPRWLPVLVEEVGEVAREICEMGSFPRNGVWRTHLEQRLHDLRKELIQCMAMCAAWVDSIDMEEET
jgi:NTP pyrophosphatase (non-canonical NTP hydrolase)